MVSTVIDPLQFAYRHDIRVDNMVIYLLQQLEIISSAVRHMVLDFCGIFNSIQLSLLQGWQLAAWTTDDLTSGSKYMRLSNCVYEVVIYSTD